MPGQVLGALLIAAFVLPVASEQPPRSPAAEFAAADAQRKQAILHGVLNREAAIPVGQVVELIRIAIRDESPDVRTSAMAAVAARALTARWAGTTGPGEGPRSRGVPAAPPRVVIPTEWKNDQRTLHAAVYGDCLTLLTSDPDPNVRHYALMALGNLERPARPDDPHSDRFIELLAGVYRTHRDSRIRAEVVNTFTLAANDTEEIRGVLRDALVDGASSVRHEALAAVTRQAAGGRPKLSFEEAEPTIAKAMKHSDAGVRLGAVRALNVFGAPARGYLPVLGTMRHADPDPQVRASAQLAIEAIERALR